MSFLLCGKGHGWKRARELKTEGRGFSCPGLKAVLPRSRVSRMSGGGSLWQSGLRVFQAEVWRLGFLLPLYVHILCAQSLELHKKVKCQYLPHFPSHFQLLGTPPWESASATPCLPSWQPLGPGLPGGHWDRISLTLDSRSWQTLRWPGQVPVKVKCLQISLLLNSVVLIFPRGLEIKEAVSTEPAEHMGKTPQMSSQRFPRSLSVPVHQVWKKIQMA